MSMFSGKCDFYDHISIREYTDQDIKDKLVVYVGKNKTPLKATSRKDLVPYYPYLIVVSVCTDGKHTVTLSKESYVDTEEKEILEYYRKYLLRIYRRCKRKKEPFNIEQAVQQVSLIGSRNIHIIELAKRISENGNKATIDGIHIESKDWYRHKLIDEMKKYNINPKEYGYERLIY